MSKVKIVSGTPKVQLTLSVNQADNLLSLLDNFYIPKAAKSGLSDVRESLRSVAGDPAFDNSSANGVIIAPNQGTKAYKLGY